MSCQKPIKYDKNFDNVKEGNICSYSVLSDTDRINKVFIKAGEHVAVTIKLPFDELKFYNHKLEKVFESGDFEVFISTDSYAKLKGILSI